MVSRERRNEIARAYYWRHRELCNARSKVYAQQNKETIAARSKIYRDTNKELVLGRTKSWRLRNKEKVLAYSKAYFKKADKTSTIYLASTLRRRLCISIRKHCKTGSAVQDLGCSIEEFKDYIASKFSPGMSWDNWGKSGWHIDHIKPLASFNLSQREQLLQAVHYTNMQPLWAKDNYRKGANL